MSNLDTFVQSSRPPPVTIATSQEIRDRGSIFVAGVYRATNVEDVKAAVRYHKDVVHAGKEVYEISAWRCMVLKSGRTGLGGPDDFELRTGYDDGGEQWAGGKVLKIMQTEGIIDAVVIVSRWFGGTLLGPARFKHIETCASEICRKFMKIEEVEECIQTLATLDDLLATLRQELNPSTGGTSSETAGNKDGTPSTSRQRSTVTNKPRDYGGMRDTLDLTRARRLIHARESAIKSVKTLIARQG
ncbi:ribosomal protein S5 domain 2-type protein [Scleroderma yunnanense]